MAQKVVGVRGMHWEEVVGVEVLGKGRVEKEKPKKNPKKLYGFNKLCPGLRVRDCSLWSVFNHSGQLSDYFRAG